MISGANFFFLGGGSLTISLLSTVEICELDATQPPCSTTCLNNWVSISHEMESDFLDDGCYSEALFFSHS